VAQRTPARTSVLSGLVYFSGDGDGQGQEDFCAIRTRQTRYLYNKIVSHPLLAVAGGPWKPQTGRRMSDDASGDISTMRSYSAGVHFRTFPVTGSTPTAAAELAQLGG
jgi:hypothetical protein